MDSLDKRVICGMDVSNRCGNVILDARIGYNQSGVWDRRVTKNHFIEFLGAAVVFPFSVLFTKLKEKRSEKLSII